MGKGGILGTSVEVFKNNLTEFVIYISLLSSRHKLCLLVISSVAFFFSHFLWLWVERINQDIWVLIFVCCKWLKFLGEKHGVLVLYEQVPRIYRRTTTNLRRKKSWRQWSYHEQSVVLRGLILTPLHPISAPPAPHPDSGSSKIQDPLSLYFFFFF